MLANGAETDKAVNCNSSASPVDESSDTRSVEQPAAWVLDSCRGAVVAARVLHRSACTRSMLPGAPAWIREARSKAVVVFDKPALMVTGWGHSSASKLAVDTPVPGLSTRQVCDLAGVAPSTLNSWASGERPLVEPSVLPSEGKRSDRYWSVADLVAVRTIKALRRAGCPLQQLRKATELVHSVWGSNLHEMVLHREGTDLIATDSWGQVANLVRHPGQHLFHLVAVPLAEWRSAAEPFARPVDVHAIRARRERRAGRERRPEVAQGLRTDRG